MASRTVRRILPFAIVGVGLAAFVIMLKLRPTPPKQSPRVPRPLVQTMAVSDSLPKIRVRAFGTVEAKRSIDVVLQVSGEVVEKSTSFETGAFFVAGDVLLRVDDTDYVLAVERAEAEVARARFNLAMAEEETEAARREWDQIQSGRAPTSQTGTPNPLVFREPQLDLARAELAAARAALSQAQVNLERCNPRAPFTGRTLTSSVDRGQYVRAGSPVGAIYATDIAEITVHIADADLAWIPIPRSPDDPRTGALVEVRAEFAGAVHTWPGRAMRLGGAVDRHSRLVPVVIEVEDPYRRVGDRPPLVEGMFVEAVFTGDAPAGAVTIPRAALRPGNRVWVVTAEQTIAIREVDVARAGIEEAIVAAGLAPGEQVCTSNLQYVTDGMEIRVAGAIADPDSVGGVADPEADRERIAGAGGGR